MKNCFGNYNDSDTCRLCLVNCACVTKLIKIKKHVNKLNQTALYHCFGEYSPAHFCKCHTCTQRALCEEEINL